MHCPSEHNQQVSHEFMLGLVPALIDQLNHELLGFVLLELSEGIRKLSEVCRQVSHNAHKVHFTDVLSEGDGC